MFSHILSFLQHMDEYPENAVYAVSLILAVIFSAFIPLVPKGFPRCFFVILLGVIHHIVFCRLQILYLLSISLGVYYLIIKKQPLLYSYLLSFSILFLARLLDRLNLVSLSPLTNVCLLIFTLRVTDFSRFIYSHQDYIYSQDSSSQRFHWSTFSLLYFSAIYFFPGIWSGPILPPPNLFAILLESSADKNHSVLNISEAEPSDTDSPTVSETTDYSSSNCKSDMSSPISNNELKQRQSRRKQPAVVALSQHSAGPSNSVHNDCSGRWNSLQQHYKNSLNFLFIRTYQTSIPILLLAVFLPYISYIESIHPLGQEVSKLHNFVHLHSYFSVPLLSLLPSSLASFLGPFIRPIHSCLLLALSLILSRSLFYVAWLFAEFSVVLAGAHTDRILTLQESQQFFSRTQQYQEVSDKARSSSLISKAVEAHILKTQQSAGEDKDVHFPKILSYLMQSTDYTNVVHLSSVCCNYCTKRVELGHSLPESLRHWNQSVQRWLVLNVYRAPGLLTKPATQRRLAVFVVSAFWHGLHPGYYFAFLGLPFFQQSQTVFQTALDRLLPSQSESPDSTPTGFRKSFSSCNSFIKSCINIGTTNLILSFCAAPFFALSLSETLIIWRSVLFYGFYLGVFLWIFGVLVLQFVAPKSQKLN